MTVIAAMQITNDEASNGVQQCNGNPFVKFGKDKVACDASELQDLLKNYTYVMYIVVLPFFDMPFKAKYIHILTPHYTTSIDH